MGVLSNPAVQSYNASQRISVSLTFDGTSGKGLDGSTCSLVGAAPSASLCIVRDIVVYCTSDLVCAAGTLISLGTLTAARIIAATDATAIDQYFYWHTTTPATNGGDAIVTPSAARNLPIYYLSPLGGGIACFPTVHDITGGTLIMTVLYDAITPGSTLIAAGSAVAI